MTSTPFLAGFAERTKAVQVRGRYNRKTQRFTEVFDRMSDSVLASKPTHIETQTGGFRDSDQDAAED